MVTPHQPVDVHVSTDMATSLYFSYLTHHSTVTRLGLHIDFPFAFVGDEENNYSHQLWFSEFNPDTGYSGEVTSVLGNVEFVQNVPVLQLLTAKHM